MSSGDSKPPPYSDSLTPKESRQELAPSVPGTQITTSNLTPARVAGHLQTCSIKDLQHDYIRIVRESDVGYYVCLTIDPTPLYYIKVVPESTKIGQIQIFPATKTDERPIAAARLSQDPKNKKVPWATICTSEPSLSDAVWNPLTSMEGIFSLGLCGSSIPIVTIPGVAPKPQQFSWRWTMGKDLALWWDGLLPLSTSPDSYGPNARDTTWCFATVSTAPDGIEDTIIEIRRGGGLDFELAVILQTLVILPRQGIKIL